MFLINMDILFSRNDFFNANKNKMIDIEMYIKKDNIFKKLYWIFSVTNGLSPLLKSNKRNEIIKNTIEELKLINFWEEIKTNKRDKIGFKRIP